MSEIQIFADLNLVKWIVTGLIGLVVGLIGLLWRNLKKDFDTFKLETIGKYKFIRSIQQKDHDRIDKITSEHCIFHKDSKIVP